MNKRVLIYFNSLQPSGGIERVITTLSNKLSDQYDITILVKDEAISFYPLNKDIRFVSLNKKLTLNMSSRMSRIFSVFTTIIKNYSTLKQFLKEHSYDYYYLAHPLNVFEFALVQGIDKRVVITEHGSQTAYNSVYRFLKRLYYWKCKTYVVPTISDTSLYRNLGFPAKYVPHFRSDLPYQRATRTEKIVLTIGRFTEVKQQMLLLKVWKEMVYEQRITAWKLQLAGQGELEGEFREFIIANNLQSYVELLPPIKNVEQYFLNANIFVLTSSSEGFGMVLLEAISFGLPCVTFDCPSGPRDIIRDRENGFLVSLNDTVQLKNSLLELLENPVLNNKMSDNAFMDSEEWNDEKILKKWHNILNQG